MSTTYMNLVLPVPTVTLGPEWAIELNAAIELIDSHDHTAGKGRLITPSAMNINGNLSLNTFSLLSAKSYQMQSLGSSLSDPRAIYSVLGDLYYTNSSGTAIQLTAGTGTAGTPGSIASQPGGAYGTASKLVTWQDVPRIYTFDQGPSDRRAKIAVADVIISEANVPLANTVTIKSPTALALSYSITLPTGTPGSSLPVIMSTTGQLTTSQITETMIATDAVTNTKILNASVTAAKIATGSITETKIDPSIGLLAHSLNVFSGTTLGGPGSGTNALELANGVTVIYVHGAGGGGGGANGGGSGGGGGAGSTPRQSIYSVTFKAAQTFPAADVNIGTEFITLTSHGYEESEPVRFTSSGTLPSPLVAGTVYFIKNKTTNTFQLSATLGGGVINLTTTGTGTHTIKDCLAVYVGKGGGHGAAADPGEASYIQYRGRKIFSSPGGAGGNGSTAGTFTTTYEGMLGVPGGNNAVDGSGWTLLGTLGGSRGGAAATAGGGGGASFANGGNGGDSSGGPPTDGSKGSGAGGGGTGVGANGGDGYFEIHSFRAANQ